MFSMAPKDGFRIREFWKSANKRIQTSYEEQVWESGLFATGRKKNCDQILNFDRRTNSPGYNGPSQTTQPYSARIERRFGDYSE